MNVEFHEEEMPVAAHPKVKKPSLLTRAAMKFGLAKDEAGAQRLMLISAGVCFALALLLFVNAFRQL